MPRKGTYYNLLKNISLSELKTLRVAVKRTNITTSAPPGPLERDIDDPRDIIPCVHYRKAYEQFYCLFDREDIVLNQETRSVLADANILERENSNNDQSTSRKRSRSRSPSDNRRSTDRNKKRSPTRRSSKDRETRRSSKDRESRRSSKDRETRRCSKDRESRRSSKDRETRRSSKDRERSRSKDRGVESESHRRSRSRERISRNSKDRFGEYRRRSRSLERRRSRSRDIDYKNRSRSRSVDKYKSNRRSATPPPSHRRSKSPSAERDRRRIQRHGDYKSRSSRSPGYAERKRYMERHRSRSTSRTRMLKEKRRSRSPYRRSRSPRRPERERIPSDTRRSSRSPRPSSSRNVSTYRRSPAGDRVRYKKPRSRSRSPRKQMPLMEYPPYYEGIPGAEYWIPNQMRPRLPLPVIPRFFPPQHFYPRDMSAGYFMPPRFPPGFVPYRQRLPVYNSKQIVKIKEIADDQPSGTAKPAGTENKGSISSEDLDKDERNVEKDSGSRDEGKDTPDKSDDNSQSNNE